MAKKQTNNGHGGPRLGAGRPRKAGIAMSIRLPDETARWLRGQTYGPQGDVIDRALRKMYPGIGK